jgi:hypothetical protein
VNPAYTSYVSFGGQLDSATWSQLNGLPEFIDVTIPGFNLNGAKLNMYVDYTPDLDAIANIVQSGTVLANEGFASDTPTWLELDFVAVEADINGTDNVFGLSSADTNFGLVATGGAAFSNFAEADDITFVQQALNSLVDLVGFGLTGEFTQDGNGQFNVFSETSSGVVKGIAVPEPSSLALFGVALLGLGAASRRKKI